VIRQEMTGERSLEFSRWIRSNLPDSDTGYFVTNLDWIFHNYKNRILLMVEEKTHGGKIRYGQAKLFNDIVAPALQDWCWKNNYVWLGFHCLVFENTNPSDGKIYWDDELITEETLRERLSF